MGFFEKNRPKVQPTRVAQPAPTLANPVPWTDYGGQGNPNAPTPTEQAGLTNAANNRAGNGAPPIAVTNNRGTGVPIGPTLANPAPSAGPGMDKKWLDWIDRTYGRSASRGGGFADLPPGVSLEQVIQRFNQETGSSARYLGGPSGDRVDFGEGVTDALTGNGQLWSDYGAMGGAARAGAGVPNGGPGSGGGGGAGGAGGSGGGGGGGSTGDFTVKPWEKKFVAPTAGEAFGDEGFKFTLSQGKEALERSAAARGTLLTSGTLKDLDQFSQGAASLQYDKVYGRRQGEYETDFRNFTGNEQARFAAHNSNFGNNMATNQNQFNQGLALNQNAFGQQFSLANLGMSAANNANVNAGNYGNNAGGFYTDQGNANAAANMAGANGWQGAINTIGGLGGYYAGLYGNNTRRPGGTDPTRERTWSY